MSAFTVAIDAIFADPNMATDAIWHAAGEPSVACRIILKTPDAVTEFGGARVVSDTVIADVRVSEVPTPKSGDVFVMGPDAFVLHGTPTRDRERLVWTMELVPE